MALTTARALHPDEIDWAALREVYPEAEAAEAELAQLRAELARLWGAGG